METDQLIETLSSGLQPVRVLRAPMRRALLWLAAVAALSAARMRRFADRAGLWQPMSGPRTALEFLATAMTAVTAVIGAFELSIPGRSQRWRWLPLPPFLLWLAASGAGCLANGLSLYGADGFVGESENCFIFIAAVSVPLAAALFWMLRRARPIAPSSVAALGTLGAAASAAGILQFFHPCDVTVIDLPLHLAAVALVMLIGGALRRPLLATP